ncbi:uncharacterized protein H6S33_007055 [Morchella sextelata]|uniref:uncharacterized protein n=1 Tax=Morchella sextelata TaxID=1174677 RepID=UPI001D054197|nr:uncharacterized protein H6S33_007055 [Morchella sextelata]KAH0604024.1 hypothetical protein H6S33_007055 [Morchella sextelata]
MASMVIQQFQEYKIMHKMGYGMMDNASNNTTIYRAIAAHKSNLGDFWEAEEHQLRCNDHVINLSVKAFLFGDRDTTGLDGYEERTEKQLTEWKWVGSLGKVHNFIVYIKYNPQQYMTARPPPTRLPARQLRNRIVR